MLYACFLVLEDAQFWTPARQLRTAGESGAFRIASEQLCICSVPLLLRPLGASGTFGTGAYVYDGNNMRVEKCISNCSSPTTTTVYIFSGSRVIAEYDNGAGVSSPSREYVYSGNQLISTIDSSGTKYHHPDHLSVRVTTDSSGNNIGEQGHYPFGEQWYANSTTTKYFFTSYERDSESENDYRGPRRVLTQLGLRVGVVYAQARYHVNRLGRFGSPDPVAGSVADPQSLNRYAYTRNFPTGLLDHAGTCYDYSMNERERVTNSDSIFGKDNEPSEVAGSYDSNEVQNNEQACNYSVFDYVGGAGGIDGSNFGGAAIYISPWAPQPVHTILAVCVPSKIPLLSVAGRSEVFPAPMTLARQTSAEAGISIRLVTGRLQATTVLMEAPADSIHNRRWTVNCT